MKVGLAIIAAALVAVRDLSQKGWGVSDFGHDPDEVEKQLDIAEAQLRVLGEDAPAPECGRYFMWSAIEPVPDDPKAPRAEVWRGVGGVAWAYRIDSRSGDDVIAYGFLTEEDARKCGAQQLAEWVKG